MRIDEDKIFGAYMQSLITEGKKKKGLPPWLKKGGKDEDSEDDGKGKKDKKDGKKKKNLPPWLKGKKKLKESTITEDHESFSNQVLGMSVGDLLATLEGDETGLYQALEKYLSEYDGAEPESAEMHDDESAAPEEDSPDMGDQSEERIYPK
jgi:hypothetical protein